MFCLNLMMRNRWKDLVCYHQFCSEFCKHVNTYDPKLGINIFILTLLSVQDVCFLFTSYTVESSQVKVFFFYIYTTFNSKCILALFQIQICFFFFFSLSLALNQHYQHFTLMEAALIGRPIIACCTRCSDHHTVKWLVLNWLQALLVIWMQQESETKK